MHGLWGEVGNARVWAALIETAAGVIIVGYCAVAFWSVVRSRGPDRARTLVAEGALTALSFIVCATLLKTLLLRSWQQIGVFACVFTLRIVLKKVFAAEVPDSRGDAAQ